MAISFTRPDPSSPSAVASAAFTTSRKGFEQVEVREFLRMVAAELARLQERERFLDRELRTSQRSPSPATVTLDEELVTRMLGEEAARILHTAREAASQIKARAEDGASRLLRDATDEAQRLRHEAEVESARRRHDASADAEAELGMAKQQGRDMVNEAQAYRERVLSELARRREIARQQIEQLVHGRDRLLQAFERSRSVAVDVMSELTPLGEPTEFVDLSPTTGPVPLMVKNSPRPGSTPAARPIVAATADRVAADLDIDTPAPDGDATSPRVFDQATQGSIDDAPEPLEPEAVAIDLVDDLPVAEPVDTELIDASPVDTEPEGIVSDANAAHEASTRCVVIDIGSAGHAAADTDADDREPAPVVSLFGTIGELDSPVGLTGTAGSDGPADATVALGRPSADDLFARLRAARAEAVVERASAPATTEESVHSDAAAPPVQDSVFSSSPTAPVASTNTDDTPFAHRDEVLTPLIVASARKLKRVLADEQNDVLHALREKAQVHSFEVLVATEAEHTKRWVSAISGELTAAAVAGAVSMGMGSTAAQREVKKFDAVRPAAELLANEVVRPLRERLDRGVSDAGGDSAEIATLVRAIYREWKTQRIDERLEEVARTAFGRGALAGVAPGSPICWKVDPNGPQCPDAEDNALAGTVCAGERFPTDHTSAPAHAGCRCMISPAGD